jgi:hypothetical protein
MTGSWLSLALPIWLANHPGIESELVGATTRDHESSWLKWVCHGSSENEIFHWLIIIQNCRLEDTDTIFRHTHTHWWHQVLIARVYVLSAHHLNWLVVYEPLWKIWVRELGWWHSQLNGKIIQMFQTTNQIKSNTRLVVEDSAIRTNRRMILAGFRTRIDSLAQMEVSPTNIGI